MLCEPGGRIRRPTTVPETAAIPVAFGVACDGLGGCVDSDAVMGRMLISDHHDHSHPVVCPGGIFGQQYDLAVGLCRHAAI